MTMPTNAPEHGKDYYRAMDANGYQYGGFCNGLHFWSKQSRDNLNMPRYATIELPESHVPELPFYIEHGLTYNPLTDGTLSSKERNAWRKATR
jgi:hypothetical protein